MKKILPAFLFAVSLFFISNECQADEKISEKDFSQDELVITMSKHDWELNPHYATYSTEAQILDSLYEGLFSYDPKTLEPLPALASSYKISRDKKRWTFTLRENACFSNGEQITAYTVRNAWINLLKTPSAPYASLLDCIKGASDLRSGKGSEDDFGVTARDNKTLVVNLTSPTAHLSRILCHHAFSACTDKEGVYSGAFILDEKTSDKIVLLKNEKYWDKDNVKLQKITISLSDNIEDNTWDYNMGKTDWISGMVNTSSVINKSAVRLSAIFGTEYLFFNCKNKPWDKAEFRNALMAAVPWSELRKDAFVKATTFVYPLAAYPSPEGLTDTSVEDAVEMMEEAKKSAGIPKNEKLSITIGISNASERQKAQCEILRQAWEVLGVEVKIQTTSDDRYIDSIADWNADIFSYSWIGDFADPLAFLELFREGSSLNQTKWKNEDFSNILNQASLTTETEEHYKLLSKAEQILLDDGVVMPISHSASLHALNLQEIGGWYVNALDIHPYKYLYHKEKTTLTAPNVI